MLGMSKNNGAVRNARGRPVEQLRDSEWRYHRRGSERVWTCDRALRDAGGAEGT